MRHSFKELIDKYGVPFVVIPNTPRIAYDREGSLIVLAGHSIDTLERDKIFYHRIPIGEEAFLLVKAYVELDRQEFYAVEIRLRQQGIRIVEYMRLPDERVRLTLETAVTPIRHDDLLRALKERRILSVFSWRSRGDGQVDFTLATLDTLLNDEGFHFFFASAPGLSRAEIPLSGSLNSWDSLNEFVAEHRHYFARELRFDDDDEKAKIKPIKPSPELAARIRQWIDELPSEGLSNWLLRLCKELQVLPLHSTLIYLWALQADGGVLCIDHEAFATPTEPETDPLTVYAVLVHGMSKYPELCELLPPSPADVRQCECCNGVGWQEPLSSADILTLCARCSGLGWYVPNPSLRPHNG